MPDSLHNSDNATRFAPRRRSVLDLAPLELDCMNTLWPIGEGTVRDIRDRLAERRPRAYTTIMTIMDRLARKGIVERRKSGRAYIYRPHLTAEEARAQALGQVIDNFFSGSKEALLAQLTAPTLASIPPQRALAASASAGADAPAAARISGVSGALSQTSPSSHLSARNSVVSSEDPASSLAADESVASTHAPAPDPALEEAAPADRIDDTLL